MNRALLSEYVVEQAALAWLEGLSWRVMYGPDIAPETPNFERNDYSQVIIEHRLRNTLAQINRGLPADALEDIFRKLTHPEGATLEARNRSFHRMLVNGVNVEYRSADGNMRGEPAKVIDFDDWAANDWLVVNQFSLTDTVGGNRNTRRPDVVLFVNGLPLGIIELKNPSDEDATIWSAWQQIQTYQSELPSLFSMNEMLMVSDGLEARIGALGAGREWFKPWRTTTGETLAGPDLTELQVMLEGACHPERCLALLRDFVVFDDDGSGRLVKKMAGYHQFHAVRAAVSETLRAADLQREGQRIASRPIRGRYETGRRSGGEPGDRRIGVVWHTQGSGKSLTMAFYAGAIVREQAMENPTIVVLTDRNDLDDQLFTTFSRCQDLLRQPPVQAESRADLREKLSVNAGGVVFTTIQKFFPEERGDTYPTLSERRNIVVIADEAHRSQYDFIDGYAR
ncbi:MAG: type I restriction endonuclease subunit R, partial [Chloroflexi bacterium]|nr:type I restriction endonuclease subunit R [Chloroflexota bacterium]